MKASKTSRSRVLLLPVVAVLAVMLTGMSMYEVEDTISDAQAAVDAAQPNVTRYGTYQFHKAQGALTAAQSEYDAMDYKSAEAFALKAKALAEKSTRMQSFTD